MKCLEVMEAPTAIFGLDLKIMFLKELGTGTMALLQEMVVFQTISPKEQNGQMEQINGPLENPMIGGSGEDCGTIRGSLNIATWNDFHCTNNSLYGVIEID